MKLCRGKRLAKQSHSGNTVYTLHQKVNVVYSTPLLLIRTACQICVVFCNLTLMLCKMEHFGILFHPLFYDFV